MVIRRSSRETERDLSGADRWHFLLLFRALARLMEIQIMTLRGTADSGTWHVEVETSPMPHGGYCCQISVTYGPTAQHFSHAFAHHRIFEREAEAMLDGLREGMVWVDLKSRHAFEV